MPLRRLPREDRRMTNDQLRRWVSDELHFDPELDGREIAVAAADGRITLRGTVGSFREKREAERAARRVAGVDSVQNELDVRVLTKQARKSAAVRGDVLNALMLADAVPDTVDAEVDEGWVTLTGHAASQHQIDAAVRTAGNVPGVRGVQDDIDLGY
jgi:osmotically-inducible protein OsmY